MILAGISVPPGWSTYSGHWQVSQCHLDGLPYDDIYVENCIIARNTKRVPLFIDPHLIGRNWILKQETSKEMKVRIYHVTVTSRRQQVIVNYIFYCTLLF